MAWIGIENSKCQKTEGSTYFGKTTERVNKRYTFSLCGDDPALLIKQWAVKKSADSQAHSASFELEIKTWVVSESQKITTQLRLLPR